VVQPGVQAIGGQQFGVGALLADFASARMS
jgi:hypothetical protein